jgi:hypothetical protein
MENISLYCYNLKKNPLKSKPVKELAETSDNKAFSARAKATLIRWVASHR